mgnify:CR=1 FL=1|tara:strand:+ start:2196 stop:3866 length:1671 start_codon:yes stop_codon:yes gene_type:complete
MVEFIKKDSDFTDLSEDGYPVIEIRPQSNTKGLEALNTETENEEVFEPDAFDRGFLDFVSTTASNIVPSAKKFVGGIWEVVSNPVTTAKNMAELGSSIINLVRDGEQGNEQLARDVGEYFANRYGGFENVAQTLRDDPIGFLADASIILTGGASLSARIPTQIATATANSMNKIAKAIDPVNPLINVTGKGLQLTGSVAKEILGATAGTGSKALTIAYVTGKSGNKSQVQDFTSHMRTSGGKTNETFDTAVNLVDDLEKNAKNTYIKGKDGLNLATKKIDFQQIDDILTAFRESKTVDGILDMSDDAIAKLNRIEKIVEEFRNTPSLHNAKGYDMMKRKIDKFYPKDLKVGDDAMVVADIRKSINDVIIKNVPEYKTVMQAYEDAMQVRQSIQNNLSLGKVKVNEQTVLNKLNQTIKNNSASQFGNKYKILETVDTAGDLERMIAGDAFSTFMPRGLQNTFGVGTSGGLGLGTTIATGSTPLGLLVGGTSMASQSPRIVGELAYGTGKAMKQLEKIPYGDVTRGLYLTSLFNNPIKDSPYNPNNLGITFEKKGLLD